MKKNTIWKNPDFFFLLLIIVVKYVVMCLVIDLFFLHTQELEIRGETRDDIVDDNVTHEAIEDLTSTSGCPSQEEV